MEGRFQAAPFMNLQAAAESQSEPERGAAVRALRFLAAGVGAQGKGFPCMEAIQGTGV